MTSPHAPVSIIICAYTLERWEDICEAIDSARGQEPPAAEIILVCDHNLELEARARQAFPDVIVVPNHETQGLSGARNSGIAVARGEFIAFLDDDAIASPHWIEHLLVECENPEVVGAVPAIMPLWVGRRPSWFPSEFLWAVGCSYRGLPECKAEVRNLLGAACFFRRDLFNRVGGFHHSLGRKKSKMPVSCEETEFCIRARSVYESAKFVLQPATVVHHKVPAKRLTWAYFTLRCYAEGVSKAQLAELVGADRGLASEKRYVLRTLPAGVGRGIRDAVLRFDAGGLGRAAAIVWGLACASAGYAKEACVITLRPFVYRRRIVSQSRNNNKCGEKA